MKREHYNSKKGTVMAFGTFDIIHPGHIFYLTQAKKLGRRLIVVIARDMTVKKLKGKLPLFDEKERRSIVAALRVVDSAVLGDKIHHCRIIEKLRPDIICLGYDQDISKQKLAEQLLDMKIPARFIVRVKAYRKERYKSSFIKKDFHG